jgi:type IV pilus assembly protein PilV
MLITMPRPSFHRVRRHSRGVSQGFTLIEVLVALLIFSLGVLGAIAMQVQAARLTVESSERNRASLMANELVSAMWGARSTTLSPDVLNTWKARLQNESAQGLRGADYTLVTAADGTATLTITWASAVRGQSATNGVYVTKVNMQ